MPGVWPFYVLGYFPRGRACCCWGAWPSVCDQGGAVDGLLRRAGGRSRSRVSGLVTNYTDTVACRFLVSDRRLCIVIIGFMQDFQDRLLPWVTCAALCFRRGERVKKNSCLFQPAVDGPTGVFAVGSWRWWKTTIGRVHGATSESGRSRWISWLAGAETAKGEEEDGRKEGLGFGLVRWQEVVRACNAWWWWWWWWCAACCNW